MKTKGYIPITDDTKIVFNSIFGLFDQRAGDISSALKDEVFFRVKLHMSDYFDKKENNDNGRN